MSVENSLLGTGFSFIAGLERKLRRRGFAGGLGLLELACSVCRRNYRMLELPDVVGVMAL